MEKPPTASRWTSTIRRAEPRRDSACIRTVCGSGKAHEGAANHGRTNNARGLAGGSRHAAPRMVSIISFSFGHGRAVLWYDCACTEYAMEPRRGPSKPSFALRISVHYMVV